MHNAHIADKMCRTKKTLSALPLLTVNAGPRDGDKWKDRLKEEYTALIKYIQLGKENDTDWFQIESNKEVAASPPKRPRACVDCASVAVRQCARQRRAP